MLNLDEKKLKCALILGILFFVLSHPFLYRLCHRNFSSVVSFLDVDGCPTELGVLVMAIVFVAVVYFGHEQLSSTPTPSNGNNANNVVLNKCRTYCQQVTDEMAAENAMMNNIANANNNNMANGNNRVNVNTGVNGNNMVNGNNTVNANNMVNANNNIVNTNTGVNMAPMMSNNVVVANSNQMNQNRMNNAMMNNQLQNNVAQAPMPSVNLNNLGMDNLNTGSTDMGLLNSQSCSDNPQCSGNSFVGGQAYDSSLSNLNGGGMFTENTTYHDDMYASLY